MVKRFWNYWNQWSCIVIPGEIWTQLGDISDIQYFESWSDLEEITNDFEE